MIYRILYILAIALVLHSCSSDRITRSEQVTADLHSRQAQLNLPECFAVLDGDLSDDQRACMEFLYAYMPLPDITDYPSEYFLKNVDLSLKAREEMPWGKSVPIREFMHFVLPVRVNNENLDNHREVFYDELRQRVQGMSMEEAILEVNHWCHEKASYKPSDSRTRSPLATVCSAIGRCGEESTFTVAALRAIGIPARQVYTPRWAHTDDNHAWVEAWADGKWHFLGACEPEPVLDLGWFNASATRGMLMTTRTLGKYDGTEEILLETEFYTDLNVTANYAPVDTIHVKAVDANGKSIADAEIKFCIYNYAEFYPVVTKVADQDGQVSLVAGLGDLVVWGTDGENFAYSKVTVGKDREAILTIGEEPSLATQLDIVPPIARNLELPSSDLASLNDQRKAHEDSIRMAYISTFIDKSRGNRKVIDEFLAQLSPEERDRGERLLGTLTDKDWTDVTLDVLQDAMFAPSGDGETYDHYVLSPRADVEFLAPFRKVFLEQMPDFDSPKDWEAWVKENIDASECWQPATVRMSPASVLKFRKTNEKSRNVFFVAGARALGFPSRIDPITEKPQYLSADNAWIDVFIDDEIPGNDVDTPSKKGFLSLKYEMDSCYIDDPAYYTHFSLSRIQNGKPVLMNYPEDATWSSTFSTKQPLDAGKYMLVSGQRLADGQVLAQVSFFDIAEGKDVVVPLTLRQDSSGLKIIGAFNSENLFYNNSTGTEQTILSATGRGYYMLGLVSNFHEPSNHALRDLGAVSTELSGMGTPIVILYSDKESINNSELIKHLPSETILGADQNGIIKKEIVESLNLRDESLPIFVIADTFNRIVWVSSGYTIGLGRQLLDALNAIN